MAGLGALAVAALLSAAVLPRAAAAGAALEVHTDSRTRHVHRITLYDAAGDPIRPGDEPARPYSPRATCGRCHDYEAIASGWHFNAANPDIAPGRRGQPWILVDKRTGTELPISSRRWPGTYAPADMGLTPWKFIQAFGRHLPGGGLGEEYAESVEDPKARWKLSGKLEIDCLSCHSADDRHDQSERAKQIESQNLKWVPVATSRLADVTGYAKSLPDDYDPAKPRKSAPAAHYAKRRFDTKGEVFIDITRRPSPDRCYFCHTNRPVGEQGPMKWEEDTDVHLAAGLMCVDCHRHGLDHAITRGYKDEVPEGATSSRTTLSCRGCHLGAESGAAEPEARGGRLGAPRPSHAGLPASHLEKLSCTACHSGPWPAKAPRRMQTARAHGLGLETHHPRDDEPPHIVEPVFVHQDDGTIGPHRMMWPAFWGRLKDGEVTPMEPDAVAKAARSVFRGRRSSRPTTLVPLTAEQVAKALEEIVAKEKDDEGEPAGEPVYVCGGMLFRLGADGKLVGAEHAAAEPYSWPLAHDVRPAAQSLGLGGCADCHAADAGFFYGRVVAGSPSALEPRAARPMHEFQGLAPDVVYVLARTLIFRPMVFVIGLAVAGALAIVLVHYGLAGLAALTRNGKKHGV